MSDEINRKLTYKLHGNTECIDLAASDGLNLEERPDGYSIRVFAPNVGQVFGAVGVEAFILEFVEKPQAALSPAPSEEAGKGEGEGVHYEVSSWETDGFGYDWRKHDTADEATHDYENRIQWQRTRKATLEKVSVVDGKPFHQMIASTETPPDTITIASSSQHAEESARAQDLPPLFPPEPPQPATPESLRAGGIVDSEASWWARKLSKEPA